LTRLGGRQRKRRLTAPKRPLGATIVARRNRERFHSVFSRVAKSGPNVDFHGCRRQRKVDTLRP
jgi:hypothetical protein